MRFILYCVVGCFICSGVSVATAKSGNNCHENMKWLIETFSKNDAGYQHIVDKKGTHSINEHNTKHLEHASLIEQPEECEQLMKSLLDYFRTGHIGIRYQAKSSSTEPMSNEQLKLKFQSHAKHPINIAKFEQNIIQQENKDFEGIWKSGNYTIGITKADDEYIGFIIEADGVYWHPGQIKLHFKESNSNWSGQFYMRDHSPRAIDSVKLFSNNILKTGISTWYRLQPEVKLTKEEKQYIEFIEKDEPYFKILSDSTAYIRIPSFAYENKVKIDSLVKDNLDLINARENLIIDIRGNGGGSDASYSSLIPLLYTNPIETVGTKLLSTPLNNSKYEQILNSDDWSDEDKKWIKSLHDKLIQNVGGFIRPNQYAISVHEEEKIMAKPAKVAIIIDEANGSTAEQFLLAAKQSHKVKLFGRTTMGVLDVSNVHQVDSPDGQFRLWYATSLTERLPGFPIDDIGIQPDYFIHDSTPEHLWLRAVKKKIELDR
ncbi:S41 family peptidase [Kangiella koreensis]|uniref:Peptidase S41 n=1 Tax=Kangiella koreensis (strain DSM 16069 / JCM 12317 / KCTC 12182 / SW-125) TaxID=523791 RepID=C7R7R7_KANKD|nr:S41 family peptidase [Kangiella koreensis]ACV27600.1 peptidase S41 [Kangiella koreensis DSM 16069]